MSTSNTRGAHILFSDDDTDDALLFTQAADLLSTPVLLSFAEDGEQLMRYLSKELLPDMIFLDLNMPVKNGIECLGSIRSDKRFDALPIIIYTTSDSPNDINACYTLGANLYIVKPNSFESIIKTLRKVLTIDWETQPFPAPKEKFVLPAY
ncbi:MAG: response regulator [Chitinophagaceae bacterium]|nr:response regulator [Chitinophagaceae bacterium]